MTATTRTAMATLAILIASTAAGGAHDRFDQDRAYGIIQAERDRQRALVEDGRSDGSITWLEKYDLSREQARIEELERRALADGRMSRDEYRMIREAQSDAERHIWSERRNEQVRGWWWRLWH